MLKHFLLQRVKLLREALFPSVGQENLMSVRPSVRSLVRKIITFCRRESGGGTHAAGPWWFGLWILEDREKTTHLFGLATGIGRLRDLFLDTVSETFLQDVFKNEDPPDPF